MSIGGPIVDEPDVLLRQLRRQQAEGARRRRAGDRADRGDAQRRFLGERVRRARPADRRAVPGQPHSRPTGSIPSARRILDFFYPAAEPGEPCRRRLRRVSRDPAARARSRSRRRARRSRADAAAIRSSRASAGSAAIPDAFTFESTGGNGGAGLTNLGLLDRQSKAIDVRRRLDPDLVRHDRQRVPRRLQPRHAQSKEPFRRRRLWRAARGSRCRRWPPRSPGLPVVPVFRHEPAVGHSRPAAEHLPRSRSVVVLDQQQHDVAERAALDQVRRHLQPQLREGRLLHRARTSRRARTPSPGLRPATRSPTSCSACRTRCASSATRAATCRWTRSRTTGRCSRRTTGS